MCVAQQITMKDAYIAHTRSVRSFLQTWPKRRWQRSLHESGMCKVGFLRLTLCFAERGTTSICQPLDRAYFRAITACLRRQFCEVMGTEVLNKVNPIGLLVDKPKIRSNTLHLLHAAVQHAHTADRTRDCLEAYACARRRVARALGEGSGGAHQRQPLPLREQLP